MAAEAAAAAAVVAPLLLTIADGQHRLVIEEVGAFVRLQVDEISPSVWRREKVSCLYTIRNDAGRSTRLQALIDGQLVWADLVTEPLAEAALRLLPAILEGRYGRPSVEPRRELVHA
jgi:hypothetical protein